MTYTSSEWPHGLRCMACSCRFEEGMEIARRPVAVDGDMVVTELICVPCNLSAAVTS